MQAARRALAAGVAADRKCAAQELAHPLLQPHNC